MLYRTFACVFVLSAFVSADNNVSIVIVGAGAAGVAAATRLIENNFTNVQILEAGDRIGGRIFSVNTSKAFVDLGAEFCHGENGNIVYEMASKLGLLESSKPEFSVHYSGDGKPISEDLQETLFELAHAVGHRDEYNGSVTADRCANMVSEGTCLNFLYKQLVDAASANNKPFLKLTYTWLRNYKSVTESSINLDDVSLVSPYRECDGDQMIDWRGQGFKTILDVMMHTHKKQIGVSRPLVPPIKTKSKVTTITSASNKIDLTLDGGEHVASDHVIFTPSLGVLKNNHQTLFSPILPKEKISAISNIGYGVIVKIALVFDTPWWHVNDTKILSCIWSAEHNTVLEKRELTWTRHFTALTKVSGNSNVLIAWFSGEETPRIETLHDTEILRGLHFILTKCFFGTYPGAKMPDRIIRSDWWTNPLFLGSYSYDSIKGATSTEKKLFREKLGAAILNEKGVPSLMFAGEATHPTMYATVHGAIESGYREAERLIKFYKD